MLKSFLTWAETLGHRVLRRVDSNLDVLNPIGAPDGRSNPLLDAVQRAVLKQVFRKLWVTSDIEHPIREKFGKDRRLVLQTGVGC
jgi:hypothetical protein